MNTDIQKFVISTQNAWKIIQSVTRYSMSSRHDFLYRYSSVVFWSISKHGTEEVKSNNHIKLQSWNSDFWGCHSVPTLHLWSLELFWIWGSHKRQVINQQVKSIRSVRYAMTDQQSPYEECCVVVLVMQYSQTHLPLFPLTSAYYIPVFQNM